MRIQLLARPVRTYDGTQMRIATAQHSPSEESDDKVYTTPDAVIMLDGASAFVPVPVSPSVYATHLGTHLQHTLTELPEADLQAALSVAIATTANQLDLSSEDAPSSTVAIARQAGDGLDLLLLGDSVLILPDEIITDDRMDELDLPPRRKYRERLHAGSGYDDEHQRLLRELQSQHAQHRNRDDGYWIAEADPSAAHRAITAQRSLNAAPWAILATDGAYHTMAHLGFTDWAALAESSEDQMYDVLSRCHDWESTQDPQGQSLPRAKRHDDKSIAAVITTGP